MSKAELKDDLLIREIKNGDEAAFISLYDRYWKKLYNYGYSKLGKKEVVEGFVQEIFIDIWMKRIALSFHSSISSYLFNAIKYKIINYQKSQFIRDKYLLSEKSKGEKNITGVEEKVFCENLKSNINKVERSFPIQRKTVYHLRFNEEMSYQEIAETLSLSVSTIEKHMIKALKQIRIYFKNNNYTVFIIFLIQIN